jgi:hypothetical protein
MRMDTYDPIGEFPKEFFEHEGIARLLEYRFLQHVRKDFPAVNMMVYTRAENIRLKQLLRRASLLKGDYSLANVMRELRRKIGRDTVKGKKRKHDPERRNIRGTAPKRRIMLRRVQRVHP